LILKKWKMRMDGREVDGYKVEVEGRPGWDGGLLLVSLGREVYQESSIKRAVLRE